LEGRDNFYLLANSSAGVESRMSTFLLGAHFFSLSRHLKDAVHLKELIVRFYMENEQDKSCDELAWLPYSIMTLIEKIPNLSPT